MEEVCGVRVLHAIEMERAQVADSAQFEMKSENAPSIVNSAQFESASPAQSSPSVVNTQFNKWLEERIAENPNLWYGFTHRRFYSQSPTIY